MRNLVVVLAMAVVMVIFSSAVFAATEQAEDSLGVTFQSGVVSKFVDENGAVLLGKSAVQSELVVPIGKGFYGYIWNSIGIGDSKADEIDFGFGWEGELAGVTMDAGALYVDLVGLGKFEKTDLWQPYVKVSKSFPLDSAGSNKLTPYILAEYFIPNGTKEFNGGLYVHGGIEYGWEGKNFSLKQKLDLLCDSGVFGFEKAVIGSYEGRMDVAVTNWFGLYGNVRLVTPISQVSSDDGRKFEVIPGGGIKFQF